MTMNDKLPDVWSQSAVSRGQLATVASLVELHSERGEVVVEGRVFRPHCRLPQDDTVGNSTREERGVFGKVGSPGVNLVDIAAQQFH